MISQKVSSSSMRGSQLKKIAVSICFKCDGRKALFAPIAVTHSAGADQTEMS
jgi:hypothetical protein